MVSIIIPAYNYAHLLNDTLQCLVEQTFADWECLLIDNGSTDNTKEVVTSFTGKDSRIKYFYQENFGPAAARNRGIELSKGEFIQFLDADDLFEREKLEIQVNILKSKMDVDIVYSQMKYFSSGNREELFNNIHLDREKDHQWMKKISGSGDSLIKALLRENIMVINSPLIRKTVFEKAGYFDEQLKYNEDWELWVRCALAKNVFLFDDSPGTLALVRVHSTSYSSDRFKMFVYGLKVCLKINKSISQWKYRRIIVPKIFFHQRVLDQKILDCCKSDKAKAVEMTDLVYSETQLPHFRNLKKMINKFPCSFVRINSKIIFLINSFKKKVMYVS